MKLTRKVLVASLLWATQAVQAATTVTFDDLPLNSAIGYHYAAVGVVFPISVAVGPFEAQGAPLPHSGAHLAEQMGGEFETTPISFDFTTGQSHVSLYGCASTTNATGILKVFNQAKNLIGQVGPIALVKGACTALFDFRTPAPTIWHCEFSSTVRNVALSTLYIDDLTFEGGSPPPAVSTGTPVVTIAHPANGSILNASNTTLTGMVQGNGLVGGLRVRVDHRRMNWDQAPVDEYAVALTNSGPSASFSQSIRLSLGVVTVTATAGNTGGEQGTASVAFTNLPPQIQSSSLGALTGVLDASPACQVAIYADGALALSGASVFNIGARMLPKWISWVNAARSIGPGNFCPTENVHVVLGSTSRQNFTGGRFYDNTTNVFYVSSVFSQAIDTLGGEALVGVPVGDPVAAPAAHTWQFQRFARQQGGLLTTIEIKENAPTLYVERQGGDLTVLAGAGLSLTPATATLVDEFSCTAIQGPCQIAAPAKSSPQVAGADQFCSGSTFPAPGVPEWVSILPEGHLVPTPAMGWVTDSGPSNVDYGLTHEVVWEHSDGTIWSDWTLFLHPLPAYNNLLAANLKLEVEIEYYSTQYLFIAYNGQPFEGDLYFVAGRWIIDCGHSDYSSEIHPPFVTSRIRTEGSGDSARTAALMWVNGYYYSGQPVHVTVYPPPRPTPVSFLAISVPDPTQSGFDVNVSSVFDPGATDADFAAWTMAQFTASPRKVHLGYGGLLPFSPGRTYTGTWTVGWEKETQYQTESLGQAWWP